LMEQPCIRGICHAIQMYDHTSLHRMHWKTKGWKRLPKCVPNVARTQKARVLATGKCRNPNSEGCQNFSIHLWRKYVKIDYRTSFHGLVWKPSCARGWGTIRARRTYRDARKC
jgi:hypothetical protein